MKTIIYLDPGHSLTDPGAISGQEKESVHVREVCGRLAPMLQKHFTVMLVPDNLDLASTVRWINQTAKSLNAGYAISVHLNSNSGTPGTGAEGWFCAGAPDSPEVQTGQKFIRTIVDRYCELTGFKNRGVFPDSKARFGRLGFVHDTNCYAGIIELCFINNAEEIKYLKNNYQLIAEALYQGILAAYGIKEKENMEVDQSSLKEIYNEILLRNPDEGAKDYLGKAEAFVRQELMKSEERQKLEALAAVARNY